MRSPVELIALRLLSRELRSFPESNPRRTGLVLSLIEIYLLRLTRALNEIILEVGELSPAIQHKALIKCFVRASLWLNFSRGISGLQPETTIV